MATQPAASAPTVTVALSTAMTTTLTASCSEDPLLDLIIATEESVCDEEKLHRLAHSARLVGESAVTVKSDADSSFLERLALGGLGLAALPEMPSKPPEPRKKQYLVESSDNDICASRWISFRGKAGREMRYDWICKRNGRLHFIFMKFFL